MHKIISKRIKIFSGMYVVSGDVCFFAASQEIHLLPAVSYLRPDPNDGIHYHGLFFSWIVFNLSFRVWFRKAKDVKEVIKNVDAALRELNYRTWDKG